MSRPIIMSSSSIGENYSAMWYRTNGHPEDLRISLGDYGTMEGPVVYAEGSVSEDASILTKFTGANVYIRQAGVAPGASQLHRLLTLLVPYATEDENATFNNGPARDALEMLEQAEALGQLQLRIATDLSSACIGNIPSGPPMDSLARIGFLA